MKNVILLLLLLTNTSVFVKAQDTPQEETVSIELLDFMIGEWEGTGWMMTRNGKENANIVEKAEYKLEKGIIVVEGLGTKTDSTTMESKIIHNAFGVIFADSETNTLTMDAYKDGESIQSNMHVLEDRLLQWGMDIPNQGKVRFTVDFRTENKWIEIGEFSRDGEKWMKFLEMNLDKMK